MRSLDAVAAEIRQMQVQRTSVEDFLKAFATMIDDLIEFKQESWHELVDYGISTLTTTSVSHSKMGRKLKPDPRNENSFLPLEIVGSFIVMNVVESTVVKNSQKLTQ